MLLRLPTLQTLSRPFRRRALTTFTMSAVALIGAGAGLTACGGGSPAAISASTTCSVYLQQPAQARYDAATRISAQYKVQDPGNPNWGPSLDGACGSDHNMTVGQYFAHAALASASTPTTTSVAGGKASGWTAFPSDESYLDSNARFILLNHQLPDGITLGQYYSVIGTTQPSDAVLHPGAGLHGSISNLSALLSTETDSVAVATFTFTTPDQGLEAGGSWLKLETFDPTTGKRLSDTTVSDSSIGSSDFQPLTATNTVVTGTVGSTVMALSLQSGAVLWQYNETTVLGYASGVIVALPPQSNGCEPLVGINPTTGVDQFSVLPSQVPQVVAPNCWAVSDDAAVETLTSSLFDLSGVGGAEIAINSLTGQVNALGSAPILKTGPRSSVIVAFNDFSPDDDFNPTVPLTVYNVQTLQPGFTVPAAQANNLGLNVEAVCDNDIFATTSSQNIVIDALTGKTLPTSATTILSQGVIPVAGGPGWTLITADFKSNGGSGGYLFLLRSSKSLLDELPSMPGPDTSGSS